jgi:hypothetical protein
MLRVTDRRNCVKPLYRVVELKPLQKPRAWHLRGDNSDVVARSRCARGGAGQAGGVAGYFL